MVLEDSVSNKDLAKGNLDSIITTSDEGRTRSGHSLSSEYTTTTTSTPVSPLPPSTIVPVETKVSNLHTRFQTSQVDIAKLEREYSALYEVILTLPRSLTIRSAYGLSMTNRFRNGMFHSEGWLERWLKRTGMTRLDDLAVYILRLQSKMKRFTTWDLIIREVSYYKAPKSEGVDMELREDLRAYPKMTEQEEEDEKESLKAKPEVSKKRKILEVDYEWFAKSRSWSREQTKQYMITLGYEE